MRGWLMGGLVGVGFLALAGLGAGGANVPDARKFGWYTDYAAARAEARKTGKPLLVVFRCEP
jgi:hypothetical protein